MSADLRHVYISPKSREWSESEDQKNWPESQPDKDEGRRALSSLFGSFIHTAMSYFTHKEDDHQKSSTSIASKTREVLHTPDLPSSGFSQEISPVNSSNQFNFDNSVERINQRIYNTLEPKMPYLQGYSDTNQMSRNSSSLQNYDPNPPSWSYDQKSKEIKISPQLSFRSYKSQKLTAPNPKNTYSGENISTQLSGFQNFQHSPDSQENLGQRQPSDINTPQGKFTNTPNSEIHQNQDSNQPNFSVFDFMRKKNAEGLPPLSQGIKRPFNQTSFNSTKIMSHRSVSEVRSDIFPSKRKHMVPASPSFTELSHKRLRGIHIPLQSESRHDICQQIKSGASSVHSISYIPNLPLGKSKFSLNTQKIDYKSQSRSSPPDKSDNNFSPQMIHTYISQEFRLNFSLPLLSNSQKSLSQAFMLQEFLATKPNSNDINFSYHPNILSPEIPIPFLSTKKTQDQVLLINDVAGLLPNLYLDFLSSDYKKLHSMLKTSNKLNYNYDSQSIFTTQLYGFHRDDIEHLQLKDQTLLSSDTQNEDSESETASLHNMVQALDPQLLEDLRSLFPGSTPSSSCLDRFISILNQHQHMYAEKPEDLIIDSKRNSLPLTTCTHTIKSPVWEAIDHVEFLHSKYSIVRELTWHFEKILERLTWGATNHGRVIVPIYGRMIGFLLIYDIDAERNITFTYVNVSYPNSKESEESPTTIETLTSVISSNVDKFICCLNIQLRSSLLVLSTKATLMLKNFEILKKSDHNLVESLVCNLSEDTGINLFISLDSLYKGFKPSILNKSCKYGLRFVYQRSILKHFS